MIVRYLREQGGIFVQQDRKGHPVLYIPSGAPADAPVLFESGYNDKTYETAEHLGLDDLNTMAASAAMHLNVEPPALHWSSRRGVWAVYRWNTHEILINPYLLKKPEPAVRNVILHEVVHAVHHNHDYAFWHAMTELWNSWPFGEGLLRRKEVWL